MKVKRKEQFKNRVVRIICLYHILQGKVSIIDVKQVRDKFKITERTLRRDLKVLWDTKTVGTIWTIKNGMIKEFVPREKKSVKK